MISAWKKPQTSEATNDCKLIELDYLSFVIYCLLQSYSYHLKSNSYLDLLVCDRFDKTPELAETAQKQEKFGQW